MLVPDNSWKERIPSIFAEFSSKQIPNVTAYGDIQCSHHRGQIQANRDNVRWQFHLSDDKSGL